MKKPLPAQSFAQDSALEPNLSNLDALHLNAGTLVVHSPETYTIAAERIKEAKQMKAAVIAFFEEPKKKAHEAWKAIVAREKFFAEKCDQVEALYKGKMLDYLSAQERIRRDKETKLRLEAEAQAAEERKKLLAQAKRNDTLGNQARAEEYRERAQEVEAVAVTVAKEEIQVQGVQKKMVWKGSVIDQRAFLEACLKQPALMTFVEIDVAGLTRAFAGKQEIAGINFRQEEQISIKA